MSLELLIDGVAMPIRPPLLPKTPTKVTELIAGGCVSGSFNSSKSYLSQHKHILNLPSCRMSTLYVWLSCILPASKCTKILFFFLNSDTNSHGLQISSYKIVYNLGLRSNSLGMGEGEKNLYRKDP